MSAVFEVEFQEHVNPKGPEYRFFSGIQHALEFMAGITEEAPIAEMTFRAHSLDASPGAAANLLNTITARLKSEQDGPDLPF